MKPHRAVEVTLQLSQSAAVFDNHTDLGDNAFFVPFVVITKTAQSVCLIVPVEASPSTPRTVRDAGRTLCRGDRTPLCATPGWRKLKFRRVGRYDRSSTQRFAEIRRPSVRWSNLERFRGTKPLTDPHACLSAGRKHIELPEANCARPTRTSASSHYTPQIDDASSPSIACMRSAHVPIPPQTSGSEPSSFDPHNRGPGFTRLPISAEVSLSLSPLSLSRSLALSLPPAHRFAKALNPP